MQPNPRIEEQIRRAFENGERTYAPIEVAYILGLTQATIQALCRNGKLRAVKMGTQWRTIRAEIERYVTEGPYQDEQSNS